MIAADRARRSRFRTFWGSLDGGQRRTLVMMVAVVAGLHVLGFLTLIALVAPTTTASGRRARSRSGSG